MTIKTFQTARLLLLILISGMLGTAFIAGCGNKEEEAPPLAPANEPRPSQPSGAP